jgi:hypothetical protein
MLFFFLAFFDQLSLPVFHFSLIVCSDYDVQREISFPGSERSCAVHARVSFFGFVRFLA